MKKMMDQKPTTLNTKSETMSYVKGMILGVVLATVVSLGLAIAPRMEALQKAWVHYKHIETLEFDEKLTISQN